MSERLGVISDTHGKAPRSRAAIELLMARGATRILHLGDVGSESVLDTLAGIESTIVFGNCDDERSLARYAQHLGLQVVHPGAIIDLKCGAGRIRLGITHGHLEDEFVRLLESKVDILLHGHTHEVRDEQVGPTRVMNPGALHRAARYTALLLDPASGHAEWLEVE